MTCHKALFISLCFLLKTIQQLVVCIVAVLVVTVASQARNNTRQQQQIDEEQYGDNSNNNNVALSATELRHPRYISRPVTASAANSTTETAESIILKNVKALVMRVVVAEETLGNNSSNDGTSAAEASEQILQPEIGTADKEPDSRGASHSTKN
jgi:hypothetical protein